MEALITFPASCTLLIISRVPDCRPTPLCIPETHPAPNTRRKFRENEPKMRENGEVVGLVR